MSVSGGAVVAGGNVRRNHRYLGENRFYYYPPPLRKYREEQDHEKEQKSTLSENRPGSSSDCSFSSSGTTCDVSNLRRFLEHTTPHVPAQYFQRIKRWKTMEGELHAYFVLGDLWESFKEWSAYGAGVPLVLDGSECVTQYYNVSLSAIQLYVHPSKPSPRLRRPSQRDSESATETSSDSSSGYCHEKGAKSVHGTWNQDNSSDARYQCSKRVSLSKPLTSSSSDENESCNPPSQLIFEYFEHENPYNREPLADKGHQSTITLLSESGLSNDGFHLCSRGMNLSSKLSLPIFGLAFHKLKASVWDPDEVSEGQKANSLLRAADNWIRLLQVNHPDYNYFMSHYPYWR
ncbi:hypothetical protein glysoja_029448 [Glycine soja]|uniref:Uncharacterized protein n=1 Tax=Glycine soja TaxID=3848 RepID=A0A0B2PYZ6_GLYSO|nr:hypothetical protein glysoja_029448 [Glycine soja]